MASNEQQSQILNRAPNSIPGLWKSGYRSPLARRFVFMTILCSSFLAIIVTSLQLFADYRGDLSDLEKSISKVETSIIPSIVESVWILDEVLIQRQLDGIVQIQGISFVQLNEVDGIEASAGSRSGAFDVKHQTPLRRNVGDTVVELGTLETFVNHDHIEAALWRRAGIVLSTNFLKTTVVASLILIIYQFLIGRHLSHLALFASESRARGFVKPVELHREADDAFNPNRDEIGQLALAINEWAKSNQEHITKLHRAREALSASNEELQEANLQLESTNREQAEFTYAISHDLKSPSNTIGLLITEIRNSGGSQLTEEMDELLEAADQTCARMRKLVDDVLLYSRTVGAQSELQWVDLDILVKEIIKDLRFEVDNTKAEIVTEALPTLPGHPLQLRMLFQNLISNALKFRQPDQPLKISISVAKAEADFCAISVKDNGIGIPPEHHTRIFGLFQRLHSHQEYHGTGLGLTLCQRIVTNCGGRLTVASQPGKGSTFTIYLRNK
jgi:signal transduction histidine kinase